MTDETVDHMAPEASPGAVSSRTGVRRVNNIPMFLLGGVLLAFLIVMALVASDRAAKQNAPVEVPKEKAGNTSMVAKEIAGEKTSGLVEPARQLMVPELPSMPPASASAPLNVARPNSADAPPLPPGGLPPGGMAPLGPPRNGGHVNAQLDEEANRIRMAKHQFFEEAVKAKTGVRMDPARSSGSAGGASPQTREEMLNRIATVRQQIDAQKSSDPTEAYKAKLAQIQGTLAQGGMGGMAPPGGGAGGPGQIMPAAMSGGSGGKGYGQFGQGGQGDRWKLGSQSEPPRTPFELRAGFVLPATLISGINSELPGQLSAQVSQDVYDTPTGKHVLVPQGSRLVGTYSSDVAYGQARVLVAWQRIVFPDGKALDIGSMPGADGAGYSGFNDKVNNHYVRLFASAILMSGVTAGITYSQKDTSGAGGVATEKTASGALSEALGQQLGSVTSQLIAKNMNIAPTLEIRPGYRFNVIVTKDLTFSKPYRSFDY